MQPIPRTGWFKCHFVSNVVSLIILNSAWAPCTGEELERVQREWRVKQEKGTTHEFFEGRREMISRIGETTTIVGRKGQ